MAVAVVVVVVASRSKVHAKAKKMKEVTTETAKTHGLSADCEEFMIARNL